MKTAPAVLAVALLGCFPAEADEASDRSCVSIAVSRLPPISGSTIARSLVSDPAQIVGVPEDKFTRKVELDVHSETLDATYMFICRNEPGRETVLRLIGIW